MITRYSLPSNVMKSAPSCCQGQKLAFLCNFKWTYIGNSCQPNECQLEAFQITSTKRMNGSG